MRKITLLAGLVFLVASCALAGSGLGLFGSYWSPDDTDAGIGYGVKLKAAVADNLCLEIRGTYFPSIDIDEDGGDGELEVIPVEAGLVMDIPLSDVMTLTAVGGAGYYIMPEVEVEILGQDVDMDLDDEFGFYAVAGIEIALSEQLALFAEAKYTWLEVDEGEVDGVDFKDADASFDGFGANAGLMMLW